MQINLKGRLKEAELLQKGGCTIIVQVSKHDDDLLKIYFNDPNVLKGTKTGDFLEIKADVRYKNGFTNCYGKEVTKVPEQSKEPVKVEPADDLPF